MFKRNSMVLADFMVQEELKKEFTKVAQDRGMQFSSALREAMTFWMWHKDLNKIKGGVKNV